MDPPSTFAIISSSRCFLFFIAKFFDILTFSMACSNSGGGGGGGGGDLGRGSVALVLVLMQLGA